MSRNIPVTILIAIFALLYGTGCPPKDLPHEPIVVIADELVYMPQGKPYTPTKDGYWLSKEVLIRLLERLEDLQHQLNATPQAKIDHDGGPGSGDSAASMPAEIDTHVGFPSEISQ